MENVGFYRKRFYILLESTIGNVKPIISENELDEDNIDLSNTYLNPKYITQKKETEKTKSAVFDTKGKIFNNTENKKGDDYGISFEPAGMQGRKYKINFSSEFFKKYFSLPTSQEDKTTLMSVNQFGRDFSIDELLKEQFIYCEGLPTNRIHLPVGIPNSLRGIGLGYIIYKSFIQYLGFGSSQLRGSSPKVQILWSKLVSDPDFYSFYAKIGNEEFIYVINKDFGFDKIKDIIINLLDSRKDKLNDGLKIILGSDLKNAFPELEKIDNVFPQ